MCVRLHSPVSLNRKQNIEMFSVCELICFLRQGINGPAQISFYFLTWMGFDTSICNHIINSSLKQPTILPSCCRSFSTSWYIDTHTYRHLNKFYLWKFRRFAFMCRAIPPFFKFPFFSDELFIEIIISGYLVFK